MPKNLIYTIAFDQEAPVHQLMAKMLISSIYRTGFEGDVMVFTNFEHRIFEYGKPRLREVRVDLGEVTGVDFYYRAQAFKYEAARFIRADGYDNVMFIDADCICMKNPEHLLNGDIDIRYSVEPFGLLADPGYNAYLTAAEIKKFKKRAEMGVNSGCFAVKGRHYDRVMKQWEKVDRSAPRQDKVCGEQPAWARVLIDTELSKMPFEPDVAVKFPFWEKALAQSCDKATVIHYCGAMPQAKVSHLAGQYFRRFHIESLPGYLSMLDG